MPGLPAQVRAVFFDAVGTLIHPEPSAGQVYAQVGQRFGSQIPSYEIRQRFVVAFAEQERLDAERGHRTDEERERQRWWSIVSRVLDDVADQQGCFQALYEHFARPSSWRVESGAAEVLAALCRRGLRVGLASNFDHRLRTVLAGLSDLSDLELVVISSEVGWKKPAPEFFAQVCQAVQLSPGEILYVGDDRDNDFEGASRAALHARLFDPLRSSGLNEQHSLRRLDELLAVE